MSQHLAVASADGNRQVSLVVRGGRARASRPAFPSSATVLQQNARDGPRVVMFDHLFHAAQHGVQGLVLGNHLEDLAAIVLQPFHPLALADIPRDAQYSHRQAVPELHPAADLHGGPVAIPGDQLRFQRQGRFAAQPRRHGVPDSGKRFGRRELFQTHAKQLLPAIPRDLLSDGVDRGEVPFQIDGENDIAGILDQHAVALFAVAQGGFDTF